MKVNNDLGVEWLVRVEVEHDEAPRFAPLNLFLTSKQIKHEAEPVFHGFASSHLFDFKMFNGDQLPSLPGQYDQIQSLCVRSWDGRSEKLVTKMIEWILGPSIEYGDNKLQYLTVAVGLDMNT